MGLGNFTVGQHLQAWRHTADQSCDGAADRVRHQQAGRYAAFLLLQSDLGCRAGEHVGDTGVERRPGGIAQRLHQQTLERRVRCR